MDNKLHLISKINFYKKGSNIHIKKLNEGKFTDYCGGKVTSECIAKGKNSSDPKIRKRATFAANARVWKHLGGSKILMYAKAALKATKAIDDGILAGFAQSRKIDLKNLEEQKKLNDYSTANASNLTYLNSIMNLANKNSNNSTDTSDLINAMHSESELAQLDALNESYDRQNKIASAVHKFGESVGKGLSFISGSNPYLLQNNSLNNIPNNVSDKDALKLGPNVRATDSGLMYIDNGGPSQEIKDLANEIASRDNKATSLEKPLVVLNSIDNPSDDPLKESMANELTTPNKEYKGQDGSTYTIRMVGPEKFVYKNGVKTDVEPSFSLSDEYLLKEAGYIAAAKKGKKLIPKHKTHGWTSILDDTGKVNFKTLKLK